MCFSWLFLIIKFNNNGTGILLEIYKIELILTFGTQNFVSNIWIFVSLAFKKKVKVEKKKNPMKTKTQKT